MVNTVASNDFGGDFERDLVGDSTTNETKQSNADLSSSQASSQASSQVAGESPLTSEGFGLATGAPADSTHIADQYTANARGSFGSDVSGFSASVSTGRAPWAPEAPVASRMPKVDFAALQTRAIKMVNELPGQAKANPWLAAGIVGVGALALGFAIGKAMNGGRAPSTDLYSGDLRREDRFEGYGN